MPRTLPLLLSLSACVMLIGTGGQHFAAGPPPDAPPATTTVREPPELARFRDKFEAELEQRLEPAKESYITSLKNLERKRALGENYDGALRAKRQRLAISGGDPAGLGADTPPGEIVLPLNRGRRSGSSLRYDKTRGAMTGFETSGHYITWDVMKVTPGLYRVLMSYGCADGGKVKARDKEGKMRERSVDTGGSFTFEEATNLGTGEDRILRHTVYPTGGWDKVVTRNIGRLRLTGTTSTLKLTVLEPEAGGLMALRRIRLVPYTAGESLAGDGAGTPLAKLRAQYAEKVTELVGEEFERYVSDLKALEERLAAEDRVRDALSVKAARTEFERQATNPSAAATSIISPR